MDMWIIWLVAAGVFLVFEILTHGILVIWLAVAALFAMVVSFFTDNVIIQFTVFLVSSCLLIPFTKPLSNKFLNTTTKPMNTSALVGKLGIVIADIDSTLGAGQIKVEGQTWSARCDDGTKIPEGTEVEVLRVEGVKLLVTTKLK